MSEEPERKRKCREAKKRKLEQQRNEPKHYFNDTNYMDQIDSTEREIDTALQQGIHAAAANVNSQERKRKLLESPVISASAKKQKIW